MDNESRVLYQKVMLRDDVIEFYGTNIGKYLLKKVDDEIEEASVELSEVDPEETNQVRNLQNRIYRARQLIIWLNEAIIEGEQIKEQLDQEYDERGD